MYSGKAAVAEMQEHDVALGLRLYSGNIAAADVIKEHDVEHHWLYRLPSLVGVDNWSLFDSHGVSASLPVAHTSAQI